MHLIFKGSGAYIEAKTGPAQRACCRAACQDGGLFPISPALLTAEKGRFHEKGHPSRLSFCRCSAERRHDLQDPHHLWQAGQKVTLDIDPTTHPAWTGGQQQLMDRGGRLTRFNKKFAGFVKS